MRLPAMHVLPVCASHPCASLPSLRTILETPPIVHVPVLDDVGVEYGFDLQITEGAYVLVTFLVVWSLFIRPQLLEMARRHQERRK